MSGTHRAVLSVVTAGGATVISPLLATECACVRVRLWSSLGVESKLQFKPRLSQRAAGLNQAFDQRPEDAIDTGSNKDYLKYNPQSSFFPVIIRIEAAAPTATGPDGVPCRNSQCTFVALEQSDDGTFRTKILKQKLLVNGAEIETQEIFGIDPSSDPECVICMTAPKDTACLPCRHMCMCTGCAKIHNMHADTCPICRTRVESLLRIADPAGSVQPADGAHSGLVSEQSGQVTARGGGGNSGSASDDSGGIALSPRSF